MLKTIKAKHKLNKWFYFIPVIGTIIYSVMVEFAINTFVFEGHKEYKAIKKYKSIFGMVSLVISIAFLVTFFVLRNKHGYGPYPWFFWVGLGFGLSQNLAPVIPWFLYKKGIEYFEKNDLEVKVIEETETKEENAEQKVIAEVKETKEETKE